MRRFVYFAAAVFSAASICGADPGIGGIEFFGYGGLDVAAIRKALPVKWDGTRPSEIRASIRNTVKSIVGTDPTDIAIVCCDEAGKRRIYVGLAGGTTSKKIQFRDEPRQSPRLPAELSSLHEELEKALIDAVERGGEAIEEDTSLGYALTRDPTARAIELQIREFAVAHEPLVFSVLTDSSDARQRAVAAQTAGYVEHSSEQIRVLYEAARDPDKNVRNNAIRALGVLVASEIELAAPIPESLFIELLSSGIWADRNKAIAVLAELTRSRNARVLAAIKDRALDSLIECAQAMDRPCLLAASDSGPACGRRRENCREKCG